MESNSIKYKVRDEITYPFQNFDGCTVEVWERISNFITGVWLFIHTEIKVDPCKHHLKGLIIVSHCYRCINLPISHKSCHVFLNVIHFFVTGFFCFNSKIIFLQCLGCWWISVRNVGSKFFGFAMRWYWMFTFRSRDYVNTTVKKWACIQITFQFDMRNNFSKIPYVQRQFN